MTFFLIDTLGSTGYMQGGWGWRRSDKEVDGDNRHDEPSRLGGGTGQGTGVIQCGIESKELLRRYENKVVPWSRGSRYP